MQLPTVSQLRTFFTQHRGFLGGTVIEYAVVTAVFALLTCVFTGGVVLDMTHKLFVEGSGDGTSGFLWLNYADQDLNPKLGHTDLVDYPNGAHLSNPTFITYAALWAPLWILSRVFSPLVALNLVTLWGFLGAAMAMYWLVKRLTDNIWVAFFAGFAVAFVPYHIAKSSAHLAYIFSIVFVLILAAFLAFWRRQTWQRAVLLAATVALAYYTDGYYLLLATVFVAMLSVGGLLFDWLTRDKDYWAKLRHKLRYVVLTCLALFIFVLPIIFVQIKYRDAVNNGLAQARGAIVGEMEFYSAWPVDYLVPALWHPYLQHVEGFQQLQAYKNSRSNASESTLYLGYTILGLAATGAAFIIAYARRRKKQTLNAITPYQRKLFLYIGCLTLITVPVLFSLSLTPRWHVGSHIIPLPSEALIQLGVSYWRVMARFFLPLHVILVLFASLSLWIALMTATKKYDVRKRQFLQAGIVLLLLGLLTLEYASTANRPAFDFRNIPPAYTWLKEQKDIQVIAEFPLVGKPWDYATKAVTAQMVHGKKLVNLHLPQQDSGRRNGLVSIANPEAIDYVTHRGAQIVVTQEQPCNLDYSWLKLAYDGAKDKGYTLVCMYYVQAVTTDNVFVNLKSGFADTPLITKDGYYDMLYGNYAELWAMNDLDTFVTDRKPALFTTQLVGTPGSAPFSGEWQILQEGREIVSGSITDSLATPIGAVIDASKPIQLRVNGPNKAAPGINQLSITRTTITAQ